MKKLICLVCILSLTGCITGSVSSEYKKSEQISDTVPVENDLLPESEIFKDDMIRVTQHGFLIILVNINTKKEQKNKLIETIVATKLCIDSINIEISASNTLQRQHIVLGICDEAEFNKNQEDSVKKIKEFVEQILWPEERQNPRSVFFLKIRHNGSLERAKKCKAMIDKIIKQDDSILTMTMANVIFIDPCGKHMGPCSQGK